MCQPRVIFKCTDICYGLNDELQRLYSHLILIEYLWKFISGTYKKYEL